MKQENIIGIAGYWKRVFLFGLPLLLFIGLFELSLWSAGESWTIPHVIRYQQSHPKALFIRGVFDQSFIRYKTIGFQTKKAKVVGLGSSRVMKFGSEMFGLRGSEFYNAGGLAQNTADLEAFINEHPDLLKIDVLLLGVDMWWFNTAYYNNPTVGLYSREYVRELDHHLVALRILMTEKPKVFLEMVRDFLSFKFVGDYVGLQANKFQKGFRRDGMMKTTQRPFADDRDWIFIDREDPPIFERVQKIQGQFAKSDGFSRQKLEELRKVLLHFKNQGTLVIGFAPPISVESTQLLETMPEHREVLDGYRTEVPRLFKEMGFPYFDASLTSKLGLDDRYMSDGVHGEEMFHVYLMRKMLTDPRVKMKFPDADAALERAIRHPRSDFWHPYYE